MMTQVINEYIREEARLKELSGFYSRLVDRNLSINSLVGYLEDITCLVAYTEIALKRAVERSGEMGQKHLAQFFSEKLAEEMGHKAWGKKDVEYLARKNSLQLRNDGSPQCYKMIGIIDQMIAEDPIYYLAYTFFAEKITVRLGPELLRRVREGLGVKADEMSVIANHVEVDQHHDHENEETITKLLDPRKLDRFLSYFRDVTNQFMMMIDSHV